MHSLTLRQRVRSLGARLEDILNTRTSLSFKSMGPKFDQVMTKFCERL